MSLASAVCCQRLVSRAYHSSRGVECVCECDRGFSIMNRPWPLRECSAMEWWGGDIHVYIHVSSISSIIIRLIKTVQKAVHELQHHNFYQDRQCTYNVTVRCFNVSMQCACPILLSIACPTLQYFSTPPHKQYYFWKKKCYGTQNVGFDFLYKFCLKHFSFLEYMQQHMTKNVYRSACKVPVII